MVAKVKRCILKPLIDTHTIRLIDAQCRTSNWLIYCIFIFNGDRCNIVHVKQKELHSEKLKKKIDTNLTQTHLVTLTKSI